MRLAKRRGTPLAPRRSSYFGKAKSCIFLMMNGGPSQVDTFDYKPELQKYAGIVVASKTKSTSTPADDVSAI